MQQQNQPQEPEQPKSESAIDKFKAILPVTVTGVASVSLIGVGIFLTATGQVGLGIPILSTVAGILLPSPVFNNSTKN